jgi:cyclopropane-fatty-acyl-phospholipid synthase
MWRRLVLAVIGRLRTGTIEFVENGRLTTIGKRGTGPDARIEVHSPRAWRRMIRGSTGMAEAYINREWDCDDLVTLGTVAGLNLNQLDRMKRRFRFALWPFQKLGPLMPRTTKRRGRKQIAAHYDLGNDLFSLFLDESMNYSSALYGGDETRSLEAAQVAKMDQIADRLDLTPESHLLEIGTGWGGLSIHLAGRTGCRITTTTISKEQAGLARERIAEAGLSDQIEVIESDYRDLTGSYDRLVSIEMIEAVGWRDFPTYFAKCSSLLKADGSMLLQAITIDDGAYDLEKASRSFISRYIFPGGCLPSMSEIGRCLAEVTDLTVAWKDEIRLDYARTLAEWRCRFEGVTGKLEKLGYDERFRRMWVLYLSLAEAGFRSGRNSDFQLLLAKPQSRSLIQLAGNAPAGTSSGISPK